MRAQTQAALISLMIGTSFAVACSPPTPEQEVSAFLSDLARCMTDERETLAQKFVEGVRPAALDESMCSRDLGAEGMSFEARMLIGAARTQLPTMARPPSLALAESAVDVLVEVAEGLAVELDD